MANGKDDNYNMRLPGTLKADFLAAAKANDRDGAQLVRDFMRSYVRENQASMDEKKSRSGSSSRDR
jgi:hypothetical protein